MRHREASSYRRSLRGIGSLLLLALGMEWGTGWAGEPRQAISFTNVVLTDAFWSARQETNRLATLPHLWRELEKQGSLDGFRRLAGHAQAPYHGYMWGDSDVYKTLEGMIAMQASHPEAGDAPLLDQILADFAAAQTSDGYLFPHLQITEPQYRPFTDETSRTCESYSLGHLLESAVLHYRLTGRTNYLDVASKAAELVRRAQADGERLRVSGHPEIELGLLRLQEVTGDGKWLDLAAALVDGARQHNTAWSQGRPPLTGDEAQGHAVAMLYLFSAATEVAALREDAALADLLRRKWTNIIGRKFYVTGGLGHSGHGEGFSTDYDLPNDIAYCETCAAIANVFWQQRLFLASGSARYIDVLERSLYNNVLAGVALSGDRFFYVNPLETDGRRGFNQGTPERFTWTGCPCCPVNLVRFLPRLGDYVYATAGNDVYFNLFVEGEAHWRVPQGEWRLRQTTRYPWDGLVRVQIGAAPSAAAKLHLRVPGWTHGRPVPTDLYHYLDATPGTVTLKLNGAPLAFAVVDGYAVLERTWRAGDQLEWNLPMPVRRVLAHEKVTADRGLVALERGPLVYAVEGVDHGGEVSNLALPDSATLAASWRPDLLGGVMTLAASGQRVSHRSGRSVEQAALQWIPYYAWNHRGVGPLQVWLPRAAAEVRLPYDTSRWVGANYTPGYAANQIQMWHEFDPAMIERELAAAQTNLGLTSLRVYLHNLVYEAERDVFLSRLEQFLQICGRHGIKPGFAFFDDCWNHTNITLVTGAPVPGRHNGRWAALQDAERKAENLPKFKAYVQDVIRAHRDDQRVLWWETYNEPNLKDTFTVQLRELAYGWAKEVQPQQPILACWDDHAFTDIVNAHNYEDDFAGSWNRQADMNPRKGTVFTEAGARWYGGKPRSNGSPMEVMHWLRARRAAGRTVPGVYLCWELLVGPSNCRWYWGTPDGAPEPAIPWCGLLWPDGSPVSYAEAEAIRSYTTGERRALLLEDFQGLEEASSPLPAGWKRYSTAAGAGSRYLALRGSAKTVAGETTWRDYLLEATVQLKEGGGNAGVIFRVNDPGPGADDMRGYYAGFSTNALYLGRLNHQWQPLATVPWVNRPRPLELDTWHLLRVQAEGARIRVWLDPYVGNTAPLIDVRDDADPVGQGAVGLRTFETSAWFDDVVVLPR